ncbi:MAG: ABC transporter permease [Streptomyces sp.]|uniref:ABC transporter permease n=1 Tax=Streptomyces sp. TaxID=1931 RepID=UPI003D6B2464
MPAPSVPRSSPPPTRRLIAVLVLTPLIVTLALWAFAWPAARTAPRELPVGVAGPPAATAPVQHQLAQRGDAFEVHRYGDETEARAAIERREIYGAVVATAQGPRALTASAASPVVAQLLRETVTQRSTAEAEARAHDVVAAPETDPRGAALSASVLPIALGGVAAGALVVLLGLRGGRAVAGLLGAAVLVGVAATAITDNWLGVLSGDWWAEAASIGLTSLAVSATVAGLAALMGPAGIGLGALVMVLLGNPFSGVTSAPEMLPEPVGAAGQWLPPGAGGSLLRSVSFFDGRAADTPVLVLTVWAVLGLTLLTVGGLRAHGEKTPAPPGAAGVPVPAA